MPKQQSRNRKSGKSFEKRVLKVVNKQAEKKVLDATESSSSITNASQFLHTVGYPAQGDTSILRDGNQIRLLSIRLRAHVELIGAATEGALIRFIVLRTPATNVDGTSPTADFNLVLKPNDFYPRELPYKYKIMSDKVFSIGGGGKSAMLYQLSLKMNDLVQFDGTGANDVVTWKYHIFGQTNHPTASELSCDMNIRIVYSDS